MLWKYSLQFTGYLEAPASIAEARQVLMDKMQKDPASFISRVEPAEPSCSTMLDLGKRVMGMK